MDSWRRTKQEIQNEDTKQSRAMRVHETVQNFNRLRYAEMNSEITSPCWGRYGLIWTDMVDRPHCSVG